MSAFAVHPPELVAFTSHILQRVGVPTQDADLVSDSLVTADLWGHQSHGVLRLPWYCNRIRHGVMTPRTAPTVVAARGASMVLDGHDGIGQVLADRAVTDAIRLSQEHGVGVVGVRNSNHFGTAAYFTRKAAAAGAVAFLSTNSSPAMAPWGGVRKTIGANPWSWAAPSGGPGPVVMDIANTTVARGKLYLARNRGESIPLGWAQGADGQPTTDPQDAIDGLILPMAEHKGYVIALLMDVLSGVLTGSGFGSQVAGPYQYDKPSRAGHLAIAIDVESFLPMHAFEGRMNQLLEEVASAGREDTISYPGEREDRARAANRDGLLLPVGTMAGLDELAQDIGLAPLGRTELELPVALPE